MTGAARIGRPAAAAAIAAALALASPTGAAPPLVADLSSEEIAITTGFSGAELLLFGALEGEGDIAIVVNGPRRRELVRRKERVAGIWVNGQTVAFDDVPAYYWVASTGPLDRIAPSATLDRLRIGMRRIPLAAVGAQSAATVAEFRDALLRNKRKAALYGAGVGTVRIMGGRLFRTSVSFPATVPTGTYSVEVFVFRDGRVTGRFEKPLTVRRAGIEARIFDFAHESSALYGVIAILIALMAGWLAGVVFRRV